jgi:hypothetical protein
MSLSDAAGPGSGWAARRKPQRSPELSRGFATQRTVLSQGCAARERLVQRCPCPVHAPAAHCHHTSLHDHHRPQGPAHHRPPALHRLRLVHCGVPAACAVADGAGHGALGPQVFHPARCAGLHRVRSVCGALPVRCDPHGARSRRNTRSAKALAGRGPPEITTRSRWASRSAAAGFDEFSPNGRERLNTGAAEPLDDSPPTSGTLRLFMSYTTPALAARATAFQGMGMMQRAFTRAVVARMITTITTAAT